MRSIFIFLGLLILATTPVSGQNLYDYKHSEAFAVYLFNAGKHAEAATEIERLVFLRPDSDSLKVFLLSAYRKSQAFDKVYPRALQLYKLPANMPKGVVRESTLSLFALNKVVEAEDLLNRSSKFPADQKDVYRSYAKALEFDWNTSLSLIENTQAISFKSSSLDAYRSRLEGAANLKRKSPFLAGLMSTVVPSSGRFYAGDWQDAIYSVIFMGGMGWQAYRGFKKNGQSSVYGWIMGSLTAGFYIGNIYGSAKAAKDRNFRNDTKSLHEIEDIFHRDF